MYDGNNLAVYFYIRTEVLPISKKIFSAFRTSV